MTTQSPSTLGDDERNDYIYKFVCAKKLNRHNPKANRNLLDKGTLYVAKFNNDGGRSLVAPGLGRKRPDRRRTASPTRRRC